MKEAARDRDPVMLCQAENNAFPCIGQGSTGLQKCINLIKLIVGKSTVVKILIIYRL